MKALLVSANAETKDRFEGLFKRLFPNFEVVVARNSIEAEAMMDPSDYELHEGGIDVIIVDLSVPSTQQTHGYLDFIDASRRNAQVDEHIIERTIFLKRDRKPLMVPCHILETDFTEAQFRQIVCDCLIEVGLAKKFEPVTAA